MLHNDEATLITKTASGPTVTPHETTAFCGRKSVTYKEFYAAVEAGLNPQYILEFDYDEFENACVVTGEPPNQKKHFPTEVIYDGCRYNIIRRYEPSDGTVEVTIGP